MTSDAADATSQTARHDVSGRMTAAISIMAPAPAGMYEVQIVMARCRSCGSVTRSTRVGTDTVTTMKPRPSRKRQTSSRSMLPAKAPSRLATPHSAVPSTTRRRWPKRSTVSAIAMPPMAAVRLTIDSSQPAWRRSAPKVVADRRDRGRHLADMERRHHAGGDQQADQRPGSSAMRSVLHPCGHGAVDDEVGARSRTRPGCRPGTPRTTRPPAACPCGRSGCAPACACSARRRRRAGGPRCCRPPGWCRATRRWRARPWAPCRWRATWRTARGPP